MQRQGDRWWRRWREETLCAYLYLLPSLLIFAAFVFFPLFFSFYASLTKWNLPFKPSFIGLDNYRYLFTDEIGSRDFAQALRNSLYYAVGVPLNMAVSLLLASLLNQRLRAVGLFRTAYFLPTITSTAAISVVWLWIYHPSDYGLTNSLLMRLGLSPLRWLRDPALAMPGLIIMGVWRGMGYNVIILLAGLQNIPTHLYEAAEIDGAGAWARFREITWPLLGPTTFFILVIGVINSIKAFTEMDVMTQGGPLGETTTITYYLYQEAFEHFSMGRASAVACILFALLLALTLVQFKLVGPRVHYE
jgi:multiple sugar transport system permease protein